MNDFTLVLVVLGAVFVGVLCTILVQFSGSIREVSRAAADASRRIAELATLLKPTVQRLDRLSRVVEESDADVRTLQVSLHKLASGSAELTDSLARVSNWVAIATPLVVAAVERFTHSRATGTPDGAPESTPESADGTCDSAAAAH